MDALLAPLLNTDGSCEITSGSGGKTRILCGVTGPGDVSGSRRMFDRAALFISINRLPPKSEGWETNSYPDKKISKPIFTGYHLSQAKYHYLIVVKMDT
jgi:hypothetical protein